MGRALGICVGSVVSVALALTDARGQVRPPGTQPGQVERQFQKPPEPSAKAGPIVIPAAGQTPPENADRVKFVLTQLTVDGVKAYRAETLREAYAAALQK